MIAERVCNRGGEQERVEDCTTGEEEQEVIDVGAVQESRQLAC